MDERIVYLVLETVHEIPYGKVASYGQIARMIGREKNARLVGKILSNASLYGKYPCHRVVNHKGRVAPTFSMQKDLLLEEGVTFLDDDHVDMKKHRWEE